MQKYFSLNKTVMLGSFLFLVGIAQASQSDDVFSNLQKESIPYVEKILPAFPSGYPAYQVFIFSSDIRNMMRNSYDKEQLASVIQKTADSRKLLLTEKPWGTFLQATASEDENIKSDTHYDAVWLRDSLWGYLALNSCKENQDSARKVLLTLWDYMSSPAQTERMDNIINNPSLLDTINGQMNSVHIRFDSGSSFFNDVYENGKPQQWNHKQNDALGLYLDNLIQAVESGMISRSDWEKDNRMDSLVKLIAYLDRSSFYDMPDSGAWEEDARLNTSSVALVTSGLERLTGLLYEKNHSNTVDFKKSLLQKAVDLKLIQHLKEAHLGRLISKGYKRITHQLALGGESPDYGRSDPRYREADAALLNLIYPAKLSKLSLEQKKTILSTVKTLAGSYGIKRYLNDNYQSANFWFNDIKTDLSKDTDKKRKEAFVPSSEAQWFFDSWYAISSVIVYKETHDNYYLNEAVHFMNRSLGQITGKNMIGANGQPVPEMALPESINFLHYSGKLRAAPSPIIPLNWSKASMTLMFKHLETILPDKM